MITLNLQVSLRIIKSLTKITFLIHEHDPFLTLFRPLKFFLPAVVAQAGTPVLGRHRQEDPKFTANLYFRMIPDLPK